MILENLKIFSQNVQKNNFIIKTILEAHSDFDIIFIQEPSWSFICSIPCYDNNEDNPLMELSITPTGSHLQESQLHITSFLELCQDCWQ